MNILSREKQIAVIAALTEGLGIRTAARVSGVNRGTVAELALRVGRGCAELHDRQMTGLRVGRLELDELWAFVGKKQKRVKRTEGAHIGDQYTFIGLASSARAIVSYRTGKRDSANTHDFIADLRERVIGAPEISTDGFASYQPAIRTEFRNSPYGQIIKTYAVTDLRKDAAHRYSPCAVIAVSRDVVAGVPEQISTSYVERSNLSIRMACRRFTRLTNGFSKKLENHAAAIDLYVAHYNFCRVHESLRTTPAVTLGITDHVWSIGELIDATLANVDPSDGRRRARAQLRVIDGGKV